MIIYQRLTYLFILLIVIGSIIGIVVPAGEGWDFANFYDAGRRVLSGQINNLYNPQSLIGGDDPIGSTGFFGTPISAYLYIPLGCLSPKNALFIFKIQNTLFYFTALILLYLHNRRFVEDVPSIQKRFVTIFAFLCLIYQPFWTVFRVGGQTTATAFLLLTLSLLFLTNSKLFLSTLFFATAVMIKPFLITGFIFFVIIAGKKLLRYSVAIFTLAGLLSIIVMGWGIQEKFLILMLEGANGSYTWFFNSSLYVIIENLKFAIDPSPLVKRHVMVLDVLQIVIKIFVVVTFVFIICKSRSQKWTDTGRRHFYFLMAISFCLLISQIVWEHYLTFLFIVLAYVVAKYRYFRMEAKFLIGAIFFLSIWQNLIFINLIQHNFNINSIPELLFMGIFKSGPLILTLLFLLRHYKEIFECFSTYKINK